MVCTCSTDNFGCLMGGIGSEYSKNHLYSGLSHGSGVDELSIASADVVVFDPLPFTVCLLISKIKKAGVRVHIASKHTSVWNDLDNMMVAVSTQVKLRVGAWHNALYIAYCMLLRIYCRYQWLGNCMLTGLKTWLRDVEV
jgi:hypothetical protein